MLYDVQGVSHSTELREIRLWACEIKMEKNLENTSESTITLYLALIFGAEYSSKLSYEQFCLHFQQSCKIYEKMQSSFYR